MIAPSHDSGKTGAGETGEGEMGEVRGQKLGVSLHCDHITDNMILLISLSIVIISQIIPDP